jgi:hypothetical protein
MHATVLLCMNHATVARLCADDMIEGILPGFCHLVYTELAAARQLQLRERISVQSCKRLDRVVLM